MFNQFTPQTTGMQIGNMQGIFGPGTLFANRNNPSNRGTTFGGGNNRFEDQLNILRGFGAKEPIDTSGRPDRKDKKPPITLEDIKKMFGGGDGTEGEKDGGFTKDDIMAIQEAGFDQQNKLFQQGLAMQGIDKIAQGMQAGPQAFLQNVLPQMYAGQAALLSAGAANTRSLANVYSQPFVPIPKMGYYS